MGPTITERNDLDHTLVKRAVKGNSYTVDPQRVATALIVKLVQESLAPHPPAASGPSPADAATGPLRQAA